MILEIAGDKYYLHFHRQYAESDDQRALRNLPPLLWDVVTTCAVHTGPCVYSAMEPKYCTTGVLGTSKCSRKDQPNNALGAKLALGKAIRHLGAEVRKAIWDAYWLRVRRPKERSEHFRRRTQHQTQQAA